MLDNIINSNQLNAEIEDYCNNIEDEQRKENTKWRFIMRSEKLNFLCKRCGIRVNAYIVEYSNVLANYDHLLPLALTCSDENIDLVRIIGKYPNSIMIDNFGGVYIDLMPYGTNDELMHLKYELEEYWKTHPLCSNKVDKYRRIVVKALGAKIYK